MKLVAANSGDPNGTGLPRWMPSAKNQKCVLCLGEHQTHMDRPSMLKMICTMLTNKAVGG